MKYLITFGITLLLLFNINEANAQKVAIKKDTIYYLLDTAAGPIKDRLFDIQREGPFIAYVLLCNYYPGNANPVFSFLISQNERSKLITVNELHKITTTPISKLIEVVAQYGKDRIKKNVFYFIEPNGNSMKMREVFLLNPRYPESHGDYEIIKPLKN